MANFEDFEFNVIPETVTKVDTKTGKLFDYFTYSELLSTALEVKNYSIFSKIEIPDYKHFKPFSYQKDSIKTMLEKFEGRGVFGDQVGLGKTIQVLITADLMFKNNEIKNCVIVCPKTLISQWKNEIKTKIPDSFYIIENEDGASVNPFRNILRLYDEKCTVDDRINVVFVDADSFKSRTTSGGDANKEKRIQDIEKELDEINKDIKEKEKTRKDLVVENKNNIDLLEFGGFTREEAISQIAEIAALDEQIKDLKQRIEDLKSEKVAVEEAKLFNKPIDLLVIDESHKVIDRIQNSDFSEIYDQMKRKYTILLSATPIEKNIDDIYDLVRFVDKDRFTDISKFRAYVDGAETLEELVASKKAMERMNGVISSLFTRKRLLSEEVQESLRRKYDLEIIANIIDGKKDEAYDFVSNKYFTNGANQELGDEIIKHLDKFYADENHEKTIKEINDYIYKSTSTLRSVVFKDKNVSISASKMITSDFLKLYLNSYLCNFFKETHCEFVFPFIQWAPSKKKLELFSREQVDFKDDKGVLNNQDTKIIDTLKKDQVSKISKVIIYKRAIASRIKLLELIHAECPGRVVLIDLPAFRFQEFIFQNNGADSQIPLKNFLRDKVFAHSGLPKDIVEEFLKKIEGLYPKFGNNVNTLISFNNELDELLFSGPT